MHKVIHFPSISKITLMKSFLKDFNTKISGSDLVSIITYNCNQKVHPLIDELICNNITYLETNGINGEPWINLNKITESIRMLKSCNTEYSILLDSNDLVILDDIDNILDCFLKADCDILFSDNRLKNVFRDGSIRLNSGAYIGKTKSIIRFLEYANSIIDDYNKLYFNTNYRHSDQCVLAFAYESYKEKDRIKIDYNEDIFKTIILGDSIQK